MSQESCFLAVLAANLVLVCGIPALGGEPPKPTAMSYQIVELDLVDAAGVTYTRSGAFGMNSQGQVVGYVVDECEQGFPACRTITKADGLQSELNLLDPPNPPDEPTVYAAAGGINESGVIVGEGTTDGGQMVGLYWANDGAQPQILPPLGDDDGSRAFAINNNGVACGLSERAVVIDGVVHYETRAAVWRIRQVGGEFIVDGPVELPPAAGQPGACALAINDQGDGCADVVGSSFQDMDMHDAHGVDWTVNWNDQGTLMVDGPAEVLSVAEHSDACGVNDDGEVCGDVSTREVGQQAVVWSGGSPQTLTLARCFFSPAYAYDVNNNGMIVGQVWYHKMYNSGLRAVMWPNAIGSMVVLDQFLEDDSPLRGLVCAWAVSDAGEIVGSGWDGSEYTAFLAVPR